jgi:hypothetical protein
MVSTYKGKPRKSIEEMYKNVKKCKKPKRRSRRVRFTGNGAGSPPKLFNQVEDLPAPEPDRAAGELPDLSGDGPDDTLLRSSDNAYRYI